MLRSKRIHSPERGSRALEACAVAIASTIFLLPLACGPGAPVEAPPAATPARGPRLQFEYVTLDGKPLSSETLRGRITVIALVTTYDVASQAQARFLSGLLRRHTPRLNVALLFLEPAENMPLVEAFARMFSLPYPVALADSETIAGHGPFPGLHHVPSVIILDREGREAWRHLGILDDAALEEAVQRVERSEAAGSAATPTKVAPLSASGMRSTSVLRRAFRADLTASSAAAGAPGGAQ